MTQSLTPIGNSSLALLMAASLCCSWSGVSPLQTLRQQLIRSLFDEYIEMYASRDHRLTERFSENFSGYTGGGDSLVKDRAAWIKITRQDFSQVSGRIRIELLDLSMQDVSEDVVVVTAFFHIHLPILDHILSRETARLVLVFRLESQDWKIVHSGISIPYPLVRKDEIYPIKGLYERNRELELLVEERTLALGEAIRKLEVVSNTDWLTGIANRRSFDHILVQEWNRALRASTPLALAMLDVDLFKHYNDNYGHLAGDSCLKALAKTLSQSARRAGDLAVRYGGEEFALLLPNTKAQEAMKIAQHLHQEVCLRAVPHAETSPGIVTVSIGVACIIPSRGLIPEDLVRQADSALYRAKLSGRNGVQLATD